MGSLREEVRDVLTRYVSSYTADGILGGISHRGINLDHLREDDGSRALAGLSVGIRLYIQEPERQRECAEHLARLVAQASSRPPEETFQETVVEISEESDIVTARLKGQDMCQKVGFPAMVQVKVSTAISELSRNIVRYAGRGRLVIRTVEGGRRGVEVVASDSGPGIPNLEEILSGGYRSRTGMGLGLLGTKRLMDSFEVETSPGRGTKVTARKFLE